MPSLPFASAGPSDDDAFGQERLIPFPARSPVDGGVRRRELHRRAEPRDGDRPASSRSTRPRRARRRRQNTPWLQRNALSIAAISFLVALLAIGFGVVQVLTRPEPSTALQVAAPADQGSTLIAASINAPTPLGTDAFAPPVRQIQAAAHALEPNYTVEAGDTLARIAARYNTTVERIQAFNSQITDPRSLRIGTRLVIPPPL
jgi:LysM repeat protein